MAGIKISELLEHTSNDQISPDNIVIPISVKDANGKYFTKKVTLTTLTGKQTSEFESEIASLREEIDLLKSGHAAQQIEIDKNKETINQNAAENKIVDDKQTEDINNLNDLTNITPWATYGE